MANNPHAMHIHYPFALAAMTAVLLLVPAALSAAAQVPHPRGYVCCRAREPLNIDGRLDEPAWQAAPWTADFVDIQGSRRPAPRFRTRAKLLWDERYLYIGAELQEPHVWATLTQHDSVIFHDNDFEVFIDPDGDNHDYYEIEMNALNTEWDLRLPKPYRDGGPALDEWEIPGLKTAVHVDGTLNDPRDTDRGWTVEMALPWKALGEFATCPAPPRDGDQWRLDFSRVEWRIEIADGAYRKIPGRPEDNWVWSPQGVIDMHRPETWGYVQFCDAAPGSRVRFRPDPTWDARMWLMGIYHAERTYQEAHGRWAATLAELAVARPPESAAEPVLRLTPDGYEATVRCAAGGKHAAPVRLHVRQDSRLWKDH